MNRIQKSEKIGKILDDLYSTTPIPLNHSDSYTLIVAVMLSAQTTDKKVNQVTPELFRYADTPEKMASLKVNDIQKIIREIGLAPTKAKNLHKMAKQLIIVICRSLMVPVNQLMTFLRHILLVAV